MGYDMNKFPFSVFSFRVKICGNEIGFTGVSGISFEVESKIHSVLKKGKAKRRTCPIRSDSSTTKDRNRSFVLEKGLLLPSDTEQRFIMEKMRPRTEIEQIDVILLDHSRKETLTLSFTDCVVASYTLSNLDANRTGFITQSIRINYGKLELKEAGK